MVEGLDDVQAFELDAALAFKYYLQEKDELGDMHDAIIEAIRLVIQTQSKKKLPKFKRRKQLLLSNEEIERQILNKDKPNEPPHIDELRQALGSPGTVTVRK